MPWLPPRSDGPRLTPPPVVAEPPKPETLPVLACIPKREDADFAHGVIVREGLVLQTCTDFESLCEALGDGTGVALVDEQGLSLFAMDRLAAKLAQQPPWSDLPFIVLADDDHAGMVGSGQLNLLQSLGNVMFLDRPLHDLTLASAVRSALAARARQFQVREQLRAQAQARNELLASEARYRTLAESLPLLVWTADANGDIDYLSRQWLAYTGQPRNAQLGRGWLAALHPDDAPRTVAAWDAAHTTHRLYDIEYRIRNGEGEYRWFKVRGIPILDESGEVKRWFGTATDIQDIVEARETLARSREDLERQVAERTASLQKALAERERAETALAQAQKMEAVGQLTGGIAHDFNNLLTVIVGSLDMVAPLISGDARMSRLIRSAQMAAERGERLTSQLLAFSRRQTLRPQLVQVNELLPEFEHLMNRTLGGAVRLQLHCPTHLRPCRADPGQLEAAILNLAINARDAMPEGGTITITTEDVDLSPAEAARLPEVVAGRYIKTNVADTGTGMSPEILSHVFEPFFTTKDVGKGTGLGLSMVYGFAKQSGGFVDIASEPGRGTSVSIFLPAAEVPAPVPTGTEPGPGEPEIAPGQGCVLVVEDEPSVRELAVSLVEALGYETLVAADGHEALALLDMELARIDLVFSDVIMPDGISGIVLAQRIRDRFPNLPILLTSGYTALPQESLDQVPADIPILTKPYRHAELAAAFQNLLKSRQAGE